MDPEQSGSYPLNQDEIRLETEILKLRLHAEFGSIVPDPAACESDPEPEYLFLKRVLQLHQRLAATPPKKLREVLDFNRFVPGDTFPDEPSLELALDHALEYLEDKNVLVDFDNEYPARVKYDFITQELGELEVIGRPGCDEFICVLYEAFHPNLPAEAEDVVQDFLESLMLGGLTMYPDTFFMERWLPASLGHAQITRIVAALEQFYDCFKQITHYTITPVSTRILPEIETPAGCDAFAGVRGRLSYWVTLKDGSSEEIHTPFRVTLRRDWGRWFVTDFGFRGFVWPGEH